MNDEMKGRRGKQGSPYGLWVVSCLFAAALLLVIAAALWTAKTGEEPLAEWEHVNQEVEETLKEWEAGQPDEVVYATVDGKVPINSAPAAQLDTLPGIGPSKAAAIVAYRDEQGPFKTLEDLMKVKGIGKKTYDELLPKITLSLPEAPGSATP